YMVGWAIRKAVRGTGARRYQIMGAVLTYLAIGMAYLPLAVKGAGEHLSKISDSTRVAVPPSAGPADGAAVSPGAVKVTQVKPLSMFVGIVAIIALSLSLPIMVILGSMPSGILSAVIIGIGLRQAWRMTATPELSFTGPLKVAP